MTLSEAGLKLIKNFEGLRLNAYQDIAGMWTIGYGSTRHENGKTVKPGEKLTSAQRADTLLALTLKTYTAAVNGAVSVPLTQNQFDALISITYNVGTGIMLKSTLISKLNARDYMAAADQFLVWNKITNPQTGQKTISNTLIKRREKERALFLKP